MKKYKYVPIIIFFLSIVSMGFACSDNDKEPEPQLITSTESIAFAEAGGSKKMHIKTNLNWNVSSSESWCTVTPSSGEGTGTIALIVAVPENATTDARTAVLTITAGGITKQVMVTQGQTNLLIVTESQFDVTEAGGEIEVKLQTSASHEVIIKGDWITQSALRAVSDIIETFVISPNNNIFPREGSIIFKIGDLADTVNVSQAAMPLNIPADKAGMVNNAPALAKMMKIGWNLGNSLEACTSSTSASEIAWGNPMTSKNLIDAVKAAGFNTVRIPCAWSGYIEDQTTYKIKDSWLARVKEVVDYCVDNDMYVIVNIHWDGGWLEENPAYDKQEEVNKKQKALWEQIAVYFRNYDEHLLFAGTNEVHAGYGTPSTENLTVQMSFNQTFVDAVRSTGGKNTWRSLVVQAYNTNIDLAVNKLVMPQDATAGRIVSEVHFYDPWDFCGQEDATVYLWGKDFTGSGVSTWGQESWVDETFRKMKTSFVDKGIPVILGEYGAILRTSLTPAQYADHVKARNYYLNYVTKTAVANGMVPCYWDNGNTGNNGFGLFNRSTGEKIHADAIQAIINGGI